ncbi:MAG: hypothetical protein R6U17_07485 [Thermoplasmata archaeon]
MSMIQREVAWRLFAQEFNQSTLEISGSEAERTPSYVVTPLGAMVNRVYMVGVLTETENLGTQDDPMWRARVSDPTGTYFVSAGQYQPGAATAISSLEPPAYVAVVGKSSVYQPDEETVLTSLRCECIKEVSEEMRDYWILEASRSLKTRLEAMEEALRMDEVSAEELIRLGYDPDLAKGIKRATEHYSSVSLDKYWSLLEDSLMYVLPEYERTPVKEHSEPKEEEQSDLEDLILEVIKEMEEEGQDTGVDYNDIMLEVMDRENISEGEFEEAVRNLRSLGHLYEPDLGSLKRIY